MPRQPVEDGLRVYLRQISWAPLLTAEEERALGWRIINDDDAQAKDRLIVCNLRLVFSICTDFALSGAALPDLIEEGNLGLIRAVEGFDPARGTRFSTYAAAWIRRSVMHAATESVPVIRIPAHMRAMIDSWKRTALRCERELGRPATSEEIAASMDVTLSQLEAIRHAMLAVNARSGSVAFGADQQPYELAELLDNADQPPPEHVVERRDACAAVLRGLDALDARQALVLRLRLGLNGRHPLTFHQIGREIGMTGEGARKAGKAGLRRLRAIVEPHRDRPTPAAIALSPSGV